jgi:hypothetical protein
MNLALTRLYVRAPRGVRAIGSVPQNYGQSLTVLAALDCEGIRAALLVPGAIDGDVFLSFIQQVLGPQLRPGSIVVMDRKRQSKYRVDKEPANGMLATTGPSRWGAVLEMLNRPVGQAR